MPDNNTAEPVWLPQGGYCAELLALEPALALSKLAEYCQKLELQNRQLRSELDEAHRVLQGLVRTQLQNSGTWPAKTCDMNQSLGEFLGLSVRVEPECPASLAPEPAPWAANWTPPEERLPDAALPEAHIAAPEMDCSKKADKDGAIDPTDASDPTNTNAQADTSATADATAPADTSDPTDTNAQADANGPTDANAPTDANEPAGTIAAVPHSSPQGSCLGLISPEQGDYGTLVPGTKVSASVFTPVAGDIIDADSEIVSVWPDSPLLAPTTEQERARRRELSVWLQHPQRELPASLFSSEQVAHLLEVCQGAWRHVDACSGIIEALPPQTNLASLRIDWPDFAAYAQSMLREFAKENGTILNCNGEHFAHENTNVQATAIIQQDGDFQQALEMLHPYFPATCSYSLEGSNSPSPLSYMDERNQGHVILNPQWTSQDLGTKICLVNWQLCAMHNKIATLHHTLRHITSQESTAEALGALLIKRTASVAMSRSILTIPSSLMVEISGLWGSESPEELDDLLTRICAETGYAPFSYARELIASPHPGRQAFDAEVDRLNCRLVDNASALRAALCLTLGENATVPNLTLFDLASGEDNQATYLRGRLAQILLLLV